MRFEIPDWMLAGRKLDERCTECRSRLTEVQNQIICVCCWAWKTKAFTEQCKRSLEDNQRRIREVLEETLKKDESNGYLFYAVKCAEDNDWQGVLSWKWRLAVLEMTGQRLPMTRSSDEAA